ncbi:MAG TPA: type I 3-dehydroquinate dehydratase, partial [Anaerohalosphaeraceae bacterium]|nr:type I 3-dehydroquinate dehydratase [Anaerohalosphaeraceae bacterium]
MTILAVSISAGTPEQVRQRIKQAVQEGAGAIELRTDFLQPLEPSVVSELVHFAHSKKIPAIVICRDSAQGGAGNWPEEKRIDILEAALDAG